MNTTRKRFIGIALALVPTVGLADLYAQESFAIGEVYSFDDGTRDAFADYLAKNLEGSFENGKLVVRSERNPGEGRLKTIDLPANEDSTGAVFVEVSAEFPEAAATRDPEKLYGPGLLIKGKSDGGLSMYVFLITPDGKLQVCAFDKGNIKTSSETSIPGYAPGKPVRLAAKEKDDGAVFFANGTQVAELSVGSISGSEMGMIHFGAGVYRFDNFGINSRGDTGRPQADEENQPPLSGKNDLETSRTTPKVRPQEQMSRSGKLSPEQEGLAETEIDQMTRQQLEQHLEKLVSALGENHKATAFTIKILAATCYDEDDLPAAIQYFRRASLAAQAVYGKESAKVGFIEWSLGHTYYRSEKIEEACEAFAVAVANYEKAYGLKHPDTIKALSDLGKICREMGDLSDALTHFKRTLTPLAESKGSDHEDTLARAMTLGEISAEMGEYERALTYYQEVLDGELKTLGEGHANTAWTLNAIGNTNYNQGDYGAAKGYYQRALKVFSNLYGEKHESTASLLYNVGDAFRGMEQPKEAIGYYKRALVVRTELFGAKHADTVDVLCAFGDAAFDDEQFDVARDLYGRALEARIEADGENSDNAAALLSSLGNLHYNEGAYDAAKEYYERVLAAHTQIYGEKSAEAALALYNLGDACDELEKYNDAITHLTRALAIQEEVLGTEHEDTESTLCLLGDVAKNDYQFDRAVYWYERALSTRLNSLGEEHLDTAVLMNAIGDARYGEEKFEEAKRYYERSLKVHSKINGEMDVDTAYALSQLGSIARRLVQSSKARELLDRALAIYLEVSGENDAGTADVISELAQLESSLNNFDAAERLFRTALSIYDEVYEGENIDSVWVLRRLGETRAYGFDDYEAGQEFMQRALRICIDTYGEQHVETATTLNELGSIVLNYDDFAAAKHYFSRALAINESILDKDHVDIARTLENLGELATRESDLSTARQHHSRSLAIFQRQFGEVDDATAGARLSLANIEASLGDYAEARKQMNQALSTYTKLHGQQSIDTADALLGLGNIELFAENFTECNDYYRRVLKIYESELDENNSAMATILNNLGYLNFEQGNYSIAEDYLSRAYGIYRERMGEDHSDTAMALENLGALWRDTQQFEKSREALASARRTWTRLLGPDDPSVANNWTNHAELDAMSGNDSANQKFQEARRISRRYLASILPTLSSAEQMQFLAGEETKQFAKCLSYAADHPESERVVLQSVGWLVNGKAIGQEALAEGALLSRLETADFVRRLRIVRSRLSQLGGSLAGKMDEEQRREKIAALESEQQDLQRKIAEAGTGLSHEDPWVSPGQLRDSIPGGSVMVQIAQFEPYDFRPLGDQEKPNSRWGKRQYVAWVIPASGEGNVRIIQLGEVEPIDALVKRVASEITIDVGELNNEEQRDATKRLRPTLEALAAKILDPLLPHIEEAHELILSPDGSLWLVPWAALPIDQDFTIDRYDLRYVVSGRELVQRQQRYTGVTAPVIVADPDYDFDLAELASQEIQSPQAKPSSLKFAMRSAESIGKVKRLPGTAREAELISPQLERFARQSPQVYLGRTASETQIKAAFRPRVMVLSTHGFFFADQGTEAKRSSDGTAATRQALPRGSTGKVIGNPLLRCGLLLAGANRRDQIETEQVDDGVLTGLEVVGIDLRGTELVVLSACETGRGDVHCGEGVAGLRQAFQFAGASAVAASLWKIPDDATVPLMQSFFQNLASGKSKSSALCEAQRTMIEHRRNTIGVAHPFYWAAFTLTGR